MSQTIFVTGASTGLGYASAKLFAAKGWKVIATMRDPSKSDLGAVSGVTLLPLDVTDAAQIKDAADNPTIEALEREVEAVTLLHENEGERP
jgi:NAD(P)-dependent dehydrogenase (short-subunit alcohol dehydrogenase family)